MTVGRAAPAGRLWPSADQGLLLDAALGDGDVAVAAFAAWRRRVDLQQEFHRDILRLLPLVYHNMQRLGVDDPIMSRLKGVYRRAWYDTNRLFHHVCPALHALIDAKIPVTLLKGAPLAVEYYGQAALRPMGDVDFMVPPADLGATIAVLRQNGWRVADPKWDTLRFRHAVQCLGPDHAEMDLHWHVCYDAADSGADAAVLAAAEPVNFLGCRVRQLDPTFLLFLVIVHGVRWAEETPVRWIPDAIRILQRRGNDVDWDEMFRFAEQRRLTHRVSLGLDYLARRFAAAIPADALIRFRHQPPSWMERIERTALLADAGRLERSALGTQWLWMVEYLRFAHTRNPLAFANGYTHYLRYRLDLTTRRQLSGVILRGLRRRIGRSDPAMPSRKSVS
ncbi:MAG: nucleotidyltransferase family protein [Gemmatimonadales bacterium]